MLTELIEEILQEAFKSQPFPSAFDTNSASMIYLSTEVQWWAPKEKAWHS